MSTKEFFPGIGKIKYEGPQSKNPRPFVITMPTK